ncbi:hypothetical protein [Planococcus beijingensis]|uniref:hypothetical protein n=1 Tax=Planococcus beijingensis TaxID=2782551 RepID=UPI00193BB93F|nr:hypothetical protein [Planococcus beijingensis]
MVNDKFNQKPKRKNEKIKEKNLSLGEQSYSLVNRFPQFQESLSEQKVTWIGTLQPQPLSPEYTIKIEYEMQGPPSVWVLSPPFKSYKNQPIPHMYGQDTLCLFYPKAKEWKRSMWIYKTTIPWISLWLTYYELWVVTGEWLGGGIDHGNPIVEENPAYYKS